MADDSHAGTAAFAAQIRTLYVVTSNPLGYPYAQHRGGPKVFLRVLGPRTLGFADLVGNRQFITQGNLIDNPRAFLFLIDYARQQRVKIWGRARMIENDSATGPTDARGCQRTARTGLCF